MNSRFPPSPPCLALRRLRLRIVELLCLAALLAGCNRPAQPPEAAANAFFAELEKGNAHAAYDGAAFGFQAAQTYDAFLSNARELDLVGAAPPAWTHKEVSAREARLDGMVATPSGKGVRVSVTLTPDGKDWRVFSLRTGSGPVQGEREDPFTLVGKGSGFNDVYHQPMPDEPHLEALAHETIARFNTAIRSGDFHDFYDSISQQWKDGQRMTGEEAAGVTEKMLKDHFQGFIDRKIDLSAVAGLAPVFDRAPRINSQGLLVLDGHFDTPDFRVNFHLEYAYELPSWKLFGINVSLTK